MFSVLSVHLWPGSTFPRKHHPTMVQGCPQDDMTGELRSSYKGSGTKEEFKNPSNNNYYRYLFPLVFLESAQ